MPKIVKWILLPLIIIMIPALITWKLLSAAKVECSLCVSFQSKRECTHAKASSSQGAIEEAHRNACALLASGVTETIACNAQSNEEVDCHSMSDFLQH